jgi:hypothetical protein
MAVSSNGHELLLVRSTAGTVRQIWETAETRPESKARRSSEGMRVAPRVAWPCTVRRRAGRRLTALAGAAMPRGKPTSCGTSASLRPNGAVRSSLPWSLGSQPLAWPRPYSPADANVNRSGRRPAVLETLPGGPPRQDGSGQVGKRNRFQTPRMNRWSKPMHRCCLVRSWDVGAASAPPIAWAWSGADTRIRSEMTGSPAQVLSALRVDPDQGSRPCSRS